MRANRTHLGIGAIIAALSTLSAGASVLSLSVCEGQGQRYGDGNGASPINDSCFNDFSAQASAVASRQTEDASIFSFGYHNIQFTRQQGKTHILAGKQTRLNDIRAVAIDTKNSEIFVLEGSPLGVLVFSTSFSGNIAPIRSLYSTALEGAVAVAPDSGHDELVVANASKASILVFSRFADVAGRKPQNSIALLRSIGGASTLISSLQDIAVAPTADEILALDKGANQILIFSRTASGDAAPLRIISGPSTHLLNPASISYLPSADQISVVNGDGSTLKFSRNSNGDTSPVASK